MSEAEYYFSMLSRCTEKDWQPSVDIYRTDRGFLVKVDLAGVRRREIQVAVAGRRLKIAGVRRDETILRGHRVHSMEIIYDRFTAHDRIAL